MKIIVTAVALAAAFPAAAQTAPAPPVPGEQAEHRQHPQDCHCCCCEHGMAGRDREHGDDHAQHRGDDGQR